MVLAATTKASQARAAAAATGTNSIRVPQARVLVAVRYPAADISASQSRLAAAVEAANQIQVAQGWVLAAVKGRVENPKLRVWTATLDGHDFYFLRLGDTLTLVWDAYSEEWVEWGDLGSATLRAQFGMNWTGGQGLAIGYGSNIVAGDDTFGLLWFLDPTHPYDDNPDSNAVNQQIYFDRIVMGQLPIMGREVLPCYAVWLSTDMGQPAYVGAGVKLEISDDAGETFDDMGTVTVVQGNDFPELSWYSLGQIEAPGRLFRITDDGAVERLDGMEMNDPDDKNGR